MLAIRRLLTCEKYLGHYVYNRKSGKLKSKRKPNPPEAWVRCDNAFESIISPSLFLKAGEIIEGRPKRTKRASLTDVDMLSRLAVLLQKEGRLTARIIEGSSELPCHMTYIKRFGSLRRAYELIDYYPSTFNAYDCRRAATATVSAVARDLVSRIQGAAVSATFDGALCRVTVGVGLTVSILIARCQRLENGVLRWPVRRRVGSNSDLVLVVRMQQNNTTILDYYVIPKDRLPKGAIEFRKNPKPELDPYRLATLDGAVGAIQRHQNVSR
jgi:Recombinase